MARTRYDLDALHPIPSEAELRRRAYQTEDDGEGEDTQEPDDPLVTELRRIGDSLATIAACMNSGPSSGRPVDRLLGILAVGARPRTGRRSRE